MLDTARVDVDPEYPMPGGGQVGRRHRTDVTEADDSYIQSTLASPLATDVDLSLSRIGEYYRNLITLDTAGQGRIAGRLRPEQ